MNNHNSLLFLLILVCTFYTVQSKNVNCLCTFSNNQIRLVSGNEGVNTCEKICNYIANNEVTIEKIRNNENCGNNCQQLSGVFDSKMDAVDEISASRYTTGDDSATGQTSGTGTGATSGGSASAGSTGFSTHLSHSSSDGGESTGRTSASAGSTGFSTHHATGPQTSHIDDIKDIITKLKLSTTGGSMYKTCLCQKKLIKSEILDF
ncbi:spore coat protein SP87 [Tieghemostelium lacteum]|uniref:Spore coat protein SP87 n=1 Tax=Tieghemostelium lacteum TaxID=361077 RepID=A0A151ZE57_TIELA|nr:spore coat protein SP87 [Tieghemostelium lacteum]|eukprot:KYQ92243.1 spore coat protein SP87 [Tieghemostelium lacteum]